MMDTILNLGLNDVAVEGQAADDRQPAVRLRLVPPPDPDVRRGRRRRRRAPLRERARGPEGSARGHAATSTSTRRRPARADRHVPAHLRGGGRRRRSRRTRASSCAAPTAPSSTRGTRRARRSTARTYEIPDDIGTAVNVVQMVFGNKGESSGTGVCFTRDPSTGEAVPLRRVPRQRAGRGRRRRASARREPIAAMRERLPEAYDAARRRRSTRLEAHYRDMQDIEFTVEEGTLYLLQTRTGKRTAAAALRIAVEMADEGLISREEAVARIDPGQLDQLLHPMIDPTAARRGRRAGPQRLAGRGRRARSCSTPTRPRSAARRASDVDPRALGDDARRHPRADPGPRRPHRARRHDLARGGRRARHGQALRRRLRGPRDRRRRRARSRSASTSCTSRRRDHDRRRHRPRDRRRRCRSCRPRSTRTSARSSSGPTSCAACGCARTPTRPRTPPRRASSAPRASASAAPSTCSWRRSGCPSCRR